MTEDEVKSLTALWRTRWGGAPIGCALSARHPDRWVRFHSLPDSKRYAETEQEYEVILDRHHRVLAELGADEGLYVIAGYFADAPVQAPAAPRTHAGAVPWLTIDPGEHPEVEIPLTLRVSTAPLRRATLDPLLRCVADDELGHVIISPLDLRWLYHPYDGGADVIAPSVRERDGLKNRHADWLPTPPSRL
ncbi:DUF3885 domain-containing protein [Actinomadura luteofluorescens]|uniref:DUF3885 domain-containing protein n=1 Tax=Actinomadura luteofluorescens TaxID=46163 RepID=UPI0030CD4D5D